MKRTLIILTCLTALVTLGQGLFVSWNRFNPSPTIWQSPLTISTNLFRWFVSSDVPPNVVVSNQWIDRIDVNTNMWQMDTSLSPTNGPAGIRFNGAQILTNNASGVTIGNINGCGGCDTLFFIFTPDGSGALQGVISGGPSAGFGVYMDTAILKHWGLASGNTTAGAISAGTTNDVAVRYTSSNTIWYVNGVSIKTNTSPSSDGFQFSNLGSWAAGAYQGSIFEVGIWTNFLISASEAMALHNYATNTYRY